MGNAQKETYFEVVILNLFCEQPVFVNWLSLIIYHRPIISWNTLHLIHT